MTPEKIYESLATIASNSITVSPSTILILRSWKSIQSSWRVAGVITPMRTSRFGHSLWNMNGKMVIAVPRCSQRRKGDKIIPAAHMTAFRRYSTQWCACPNSTSPRNVLVIVGKLIGRFEGSFAARIAIFRRALEENEARLVCLIKVVIRWNVDLQRG